MKLEKITFNSKDDDAYPATVTVTMHIAEALWIALVAGEQCGESPHNAIYDCLIKNVFNRYWEDGVEGASRDYPVKIPPIKY